MSAYTVNQDEIKKLQEQIKMLSEKVQRLEIQMVKPAERGDIAKRSIHPYHFATQDAGWAVTNVTPDKIYDANATSTAELADVLGTLIDTLISYGILKA